MKRSGIGRRKPMPPPRQPMTRTAPMPRSSLRQAAQGRQAPRKAARGTGFSAAVKLAIRTRAGQGDPNAASCEACGRWLGRGGEVQHIQARGMGGSRRRNVVTNGVLLCARHHTLVHHDGWHIDLIDGKPWFVPPAWIDPRRTPRLNSRYKTKQLDDP